MPISVGANADLRSKNARSDCQVITPLVRALVEAFLEHIKFVIVEGLTFGVVRTLSLLASLHPATPSATTAVPNQEGTCIGAHTT